MIRIRRSLVVIPFIASMSIVAGCNDSGDDNPRRVSPGERIEKCEIRYRKGTQREVLPAPKSEAGERHNCKVFEESGHLDDSGLLDKAASLDM